MKYLTLIVVLLGILTMTRSSRSQNFHSDSCIDLVCSYLYPFDCDSGTELHAIASTCSDHSLSLNCFKYISAKVSVFDKETWPQLESLLMSCRETWDLNCLGEFYRRLGHFETEGSDKARQIARACRQVQGSCVKQVCNKLGAFECSSLAQMEDIARSCRRH